MPENLFRMLASLAVVWTLAGSPPGHAADYGRFEEFTLYTKDGETASEFKADVIVTLHGFGSANPNRTYKIFHKAFPFCLRRYPNPAIIAALSIHNGIGGQNSSICSSFSA